MILFLGKKLILDPLSVFFFKFIYIFINYFIQFFIFFIFFFIFFNFIINILSECLYLFNISGVVKFSDKSNIFLSFAINFL